MKLTKRAKDRTGEVYGELTVLRALRRNKHSQIVWECKCSCGSVTEVPSGHLGHRTKSCGCLKKGTNKNSRASCHAAGSESPYWKGIGEISGYKLSKIRYAATKRDLIYEVEDDYIWKLFLKQDRKCALSGLPIEFGTKGRELGTASLDRIDSTKGYTPENVQWLHKDINQMKMDLTEQKFVDLCKRVCYISNTKTK